MKKFLSIVLSITMFCAFSSNVVFAIDTGGEINIKENIIKDYRERIFEYNKQANSDITAVSLDSEQSLAQIQTETVNELKNAGYNAYDVNPSTFSNIENILHTDLEAAGLNPNYSYIIVIEGEDNENVNSRVATSSSFSHTYNGTTYTLRWMTMYATDDPLMGKASDVNVLSSATTSVIKNCLDTAVSTYISSISRTLGTVASICGLSISNFAPAQTATMRLNGATNWTRRYTQVWNSYDSAWQNGCCVEEVTAYSYMSGSYYDASSNLYRSVPENKAYDTRYSSRYDDDKWRKDYAVVGYLNSWIQWDTVGDVVYKYNGTTKITHKHNF